MRTSFNIGLLISLWIFTLPLYAVDSHLPPSLADAVNQATTDAPNHAIKTPEYVIIRANEETTFSSETSGSVISLPVKEGSSFNKGEVLLKLDCRLQQAELNKAKADQVAANKALQSAKKLKSYGAISDFEVVKTKADSDSANAEVDKLKAIANKCTITAPFAGGVSEVRVHLYETVKPGDPLLKVTNTEDLSAEVQVPSRWLAWLKVGSHFNVYVNDIDKTIPATVSHINPEIEPISQTVKITGEIVSSENLKPGMTGQAFFADNPDGNKG